MQDWNLWLNSSETRIALKTIKEEAEELRDIITDGSHLQEKRIDSVALDYTYSIGQLDGMRRVIQMLEDIAAIVEEEDGN